MDYLKYVPILNLVLIVILFILWFRAHSEQFETDSTPTSSTVYNFMGVDNSGDIKIVPIDTQKMYTELFEPYVTTKDIQKKLSLYAKDKEAKQMIQIERNLRNLLN